MKNETKTLENLVRHTQDSINGYREAAEMVMDKHPELAGIFTQRMEKRAQLLQSLRNHLRVVDPGNKALAADSTATGKMHQSFMKFRGLFQKDHKVALSEVEHGETFLIHSFEDAMKDVSPELRAILQECLTSLRNDESTVEAMRNAA